MLIETCIRWTALGLMAACAGGVTHYGGYPALVWMLGGLLSSMVWAAVVVRRIHLRALQDVQDGQDVQDVSSAVNTPSATHALTLTNRKQLSDALESIGVKPYIAEVIAVELLAAYPSATLAQLMQKAIAPTGAPTKETKV